MHSIKDILQRLNEIAEIPEVGDKFCFEFGDILQVETEVTEITESNDIVIHGDDMLLSLLEGLETIYITHINEAKYQGRTVPLNKPMRGDSKKFKVFVRDPKTKNIKKVNFGDPNMRIKKSNPARRKSFRARHKCATAKDKTTARFWSCKAW
jgi:hypothetical protein